METEELFQIAGHFQVGGQVLSAAPVHTGHINSTYRLTVRKDGSACYYTLQEVNQYVFRQPVFVMENIAAITEHLREKIRAENGDVDRRVLTIIPSTAGKNYYIDKRGRFWRMYKYIDKASTYDTVTEKKHLYSAGKGFGIFQRHLADFPIHKLHETIPDFHNTKKRMKTLFDTVKEDPKNRAAQARKEIAFLEKNAAFASMLVEMQENGTLPLRVTHNDTKYNNILIDDETGESLCVIDLDTVMPGLAAADFGDAIRFAANTGAEDEPDTAKVSLNMELYEAFASGFIGSTAGLLGKEELRSMPLGARILTIELAARFLTDFLMGDPYFKIKDPLHNLVRTRAQIALAADMERKNDEMCAVVERYL